MGTEPVVVAGGGAVDWLYVQYLPGQAKILLRVAIAAGTRLPPGPR